MLVLVAEKHISATSGSGGGGESMSHQLIVRGTTDAETIVMAATTMTLVAIAVVLEVTGRRARAVTGAADLFCGRRGRPGMSRGVARLLSCDVCPGQDPFFGHAVLHKLSTLSDTMIEWTKAPGKPHNHVEIASVGSVRILLQRHSYRGCLQYQRTS
jgi:hypothetical protein